MSAKKFFNIHHKKNRIRCPNTTITAEKVASKTTPVAQVCYFSLKVKRATRVVGGVADLGFEPLGNQLEQLLGATLSHLLVPLLGALSAVSWETVLLKEQDVVLQGLDPELSVD